VALDSGGALGQLPPQQYGGIIALHVRAELSTMARVAGCRRLTRAAGWLLRGGDRTHYTS
jgi:hypothetical protein